MQSIKEHNLKANHNSLVSIGKKDRSVCNLSKNTIWKQITTPHWFRFELTSLYAIYQRTQSESKSQLWLYFGDSQHICMQSIKEHNLKANHNRVQSCQFILRSVCNLSKNTIWKQITTIFGGSTPTLDLYAIYQRTQSESKSQLGGHWWCFYKSVCNLSKNTIWKQITTRSSWLFTFVFCMQSIKEHNLKANHNIERKPQYITDLYAIYQRTQSESKSQRKLYTSAHLAICMQSIKEHNLKANHNRSAR